MRKGNFLLKSMSRKLFLLIFITLIPLTFLKIYEIQGKIKISINEEMKANQGFVEALSLTFSNYVEKVWTNEYSMGLCIALNKTWSQQDIEQYMMTVLSNDEGILGYTWINPNGDVVASTREVVEGQNLLYREYIQEILNGKDKAISNILLSSDGKDVIVPVAKAIKIDNELKGIIISVIDVRNLPKVFPLERMNKTSRYGIVDKSGMLVYVSGKFDIPFEKRRIKDDSTMWKALKGEIVKTEARVSSLDSTERMGVNYPIKELGWGCFSSTSVSEVTANFIKPVKHELILLSLVYAISFIIAYFIGKQHIYSINKLKYATNEVINGNLLYKTDIKANDELGDIGKAFNQMTEGFNQKIHEVEEYNSIKSQFLSTMSHELKTPLNIILGCVQLIEKLDINNKSLSKYTKMLRQNSFRLLRLINNLIDINKIEVNSLTLSLKNDDIIRVIEDISMSVVEYTNLKQISLIFDTEVEEKYMAFDPDKIERIVLNLLSNAIKFTDIGGSIEINIYDKGDSIIVSIKDSGIGIPLDMQEKIFERFTQVDGSLRRAEGSGIGLSLVKSLVELHDGKITVYSELGKGSEFSIELPVRLVETETIANSNNTIANVERIHVEFSDIYT